MSRESKVLNAYEWGVQETVSHYEAFGWELLSLNGKQITMSRETQNPVYTDLVKFQAKYEEKVNEYYALVPPTAPVKPARVKAKTCFYALLCFVIPLVVYVTYKVLQFKKYNEQLTAYNSAMDKYNAKRRELRAEMEKIVLDSRVTFFAKQA